MDFSAATDAPVVATIDGQTVSFPVFSLGKVMLLCALLAEANVQATAAAGKEAGTPGDVLVDAIARARVRGADPGDALQFAQSVAGAVWILSQALLPLEIFGALKDHPIPPQVERIPFLELVPLALQVLRVTGPNTGNGAPDPTGPAAVG